MPSFLEVISIIVSLILASISTHETLFPLIARSPTYVVNFLPNSPAGCDFAKSSLEKFFSSIKEIANASPITIDAVVELVGARSCGQASFST